MINRISLLGLLTVLLVFVNFYLLYEFSPEIHRWGRIAGSLCFLILFITQVSKTNYPLVGTLALFVVADVFALKYDLLLSKQAFFTFQSLAYFFMLLKIRKKMKKIKIGGYEKWFLTGLFVINLSFVFFMGGIFSEEIDDHFLIALFYIYAFLAVILLSSGIIYYNSLTDNKAMAFMLAGIGLVFSNITGFSAHFLEYTELFYADRLLYIAGMGSLLYFGTYQEQTLLKHDYLKEATTNEAKFFHQGDVDVLEKYGS